MENPYIQLTKFYFKVEGEVLEIAYNHPEGLIEVSETRRNGQEDTHMSGLIDKVDGRYMWSKVFDEDEPGRNMFAIYHSKELVNGIISYLNENGVPGPIETLLKEREEKRDEAEDLRKLAGAFFNWLQIDDCEYGGIGLDCKSPFGGSFPDHAILEIIGWEPEEKSLDRQIDYARNLYSNKLVPYLQKFWESHQTHK